ncbi:hypothetical protein [Acidovorax sp. NCPPB 4044]|uniref:hypothetical protein n=1 Tax=Acidovorax sp. NCPPB 4044 TaxID=2940490 RepID=UPI002302594A|nr:hypothetical protein [Acidovorax sp. NCPPB 4044]MDA8522780.1 hypothetical protein [Acidovorax sp. NCPPB 4044]
MSTMVTGYSASISIRVGIARTGTTAGNAAAQTRQASAALEKHMQQRGIDTLTPNLLSQLARNAPGDTPDDVSEAAAFLLRNPDIYALLETHDVAGRDGISGASNLGFAARGGYDARLQDAPPATAQPAVTEQEAAGALAAFRQQHPAAPIDANTLYRLAMRPNSDTSPATSAAARFLLQNPEALDRIAAQNAGSGAAGAPPKGPAQGATTLPGQDRVAPVQARPGRGSGDAAQTLDAQSAARILADHMLHGKPRALAGIFGTQAMTVDRLYRLAEGGKASPEVAAAARFMLQNPDIYRAIETHDVPGADGKSGVGNLLAAARGDIPGVGGKASGAANGVLQLLLQLLRALNGTASAASAARTPAAQPLDAQSASRILADHMVSEAGGARNLFGKRFLPKTAPMTAERLYQLSQGQGPVADAAKFMLQNPDIYRAIETHDVPGADGKSGLGNLLAAARGEVPGAGGGVQGRLGDLLQQLQLLLLLLKSFSQASQAASPSAPKQPLDAQSAARTLADHMVAEGGGVKNLFGKHFLPRPRPMTIERLQQLSQGQGPVAEAAKFMLQNPDIYRAIETHDVRGADGKSGLGNLLAAARGEVPGVNGQAGQLLQQLQQLLQVLRALMPQVQGTAGTQAPLDGQSAARVLADHLLAQAGPPRRLLGRQLIDASKVETLTPDRLYQLSQGQGPVADAAKFMLQNPDIYRAIDTHDVPGADGESSIGNLLAAANGKVPGVQGGAASRLAGTSRSVQDVLQQILPMLPGSNGAQTTAMAQALDGQSAARTLADHMLKISASELARVFEPGDMTPDRLYKLAESGTAPPEVEAAAKFMLQNPDVYRAIETHDVPGADGQSAVGNLLAAARGEVPGVTGIAAPAGGTPGTNGTGGTATAQGSNPLAAIRELLGQALEGLQAREQHRVAQIEIQITIRTQVTVVA